MIRIGSVTFVHHGDGTGHLELAFSELRDDGSIAGEGRTQVAATREQATALLSLASAVLAVELPKARPENLTVALEAYRKAEAARAEAERGKAQLDAEIEQRRAELGR